MSSASSSSSPASESLNLSEDQQFPALCCIMEAVNETCRGIDDTQYAIEGNRSLTDFEKFLCKLALTCHTEKGPDAITALVCLKNSSGGGEFLFTSNSRNETEMSKTKRFLEDLLGFVSTNPLNLNPKPLQKQVLWRILEANFSKVVDYLKALQSSLAVCLAQFENGHVELDEYAQSQLETLAIRAEFPLDMVSTANSRQIFLASCETLIKAIQETKAIQIRRGTPLEMKIETLSRTGLIKYNPWHTLRHCLGRLHSYRQATEIIVLSPKRWPRLYKEFTVSYVSSSPRKRQLLPPSTWKSVDFIKAAFPDLNPKYIANDIDVLQSFGFEEHLQYRTQKKADRISVHCEVNLHDHLVREGKTRCSDYGEDSLFIATSKPPCRLCHYYFSSPSNDFRVQPPHMNTYVKWRLPESCNEDVKEDIVEQLQHDILKMIREKTPSYRRNDSRTDSHTGTGFHTQGTIPSTSQADLNEWEFINSQVPRAIDGMHRSGIYSQVRPFEEHNATLASERNYGIIGDRNPAADSARRNKPNIGS